MPKPPSFGHLAVGVTVGPAGEAEPVDPETPFRILLLGDFRGRADRAARRPVRIDRDNFDEVLARFGVEVDLPVPGQDGARCTVRFAALDDFHPDRLFQRVEAFRQLRGLRGRLADASTFAQAAAEFRTLFPSGEAEKPAPSAPEPAPPSDPADLLSRIIGEAPAVAWPGERGPGLGDWQKFIQKVAEPHTLPRIDYAQQSALVALTDEMTGQLMRGVLHHPAYQAVEAAWRAAYFLVRRLDTDANLQLHLLDISKDELASDLSAAEDLGSAQTYRLLVEQTVGRPGGEPWAVLAGLYTFDADPADAELLGRMAKVAHRAGAPFLAAAGCRVLGCRSLAETPDPDDWKQPADAEGAAAWQALRQLPEAAYLGLALPRFVLRLPYGKDSDATEPFAFEELPAGSGHESYLWGNPAVVCACLLGQGFSSHGWGLRPGVPQEVDRLPVPIYQEDGESQAKPCAEAWLTTRAAGAILDKGIMPLLSIQGQDVVRVGRFQALASPARPLAGRWA